MARMYLNLEEMKEIARRLPIGYYLGRKTPVIVEMGAHAYCDTIKGDIHIGIGLLQHAANNIDPKEAKEWDRETLLRCLLYHEIGHLLLTPNDLGRATISYKGVVPSTKETHALVNIFEDERIEQLLASVFYGVNFKKFLRLVNKKGTKESNDLIGKVYKAIRLRETSQQISDEIDNAIESLRMMNASHNRYISWLPREFDEKLSQIIEMILKEQDDKDKDGGKGESSEQPQDKKEQEQKEGENPEEDGKGQGGNSSKDKEDETDEESNGGDGESDEDEETPPNDDSGSGGNGNGDNPNGEEEKDGGANEEPSNDKDDNPPKGNDGETDEEETAATPSDEEQSPSDEIGRTPTGREIKLPDDYLASLASTVFSSPPPNVTKVLDRFASRLAKKKGQQSASCWSGLHGRLESKRDAMDKDKIFRRKSDVGDRMMQSVKLNLWVDVSQSFRRSKEELNNILSAVAKTLRMASNKLDVSVIHAGEQACIAPSNRWAVDPNSDNQINETFLEAWKKSRCKDRRNIDIVVFDGCCCISACALHVKQDHPRILFETDIARKIWNSHDCWIVCDCENREFFEASVPKAHVTYIPSDYAQHLQSKVIEILDRIL